MSWTVWQRRSKCQECGARISVPPEGLTMTCEYCGAEGPVPDFESRKAAQEQQERERQRQKRKDERRAKKQEREREQSRREPPPRRRGGVGGSALGTLIFFAILAYTMYEAGILKQLISSARQLLAKQVPALSEAPPPAPDASARQQQQAPGRTTANKKRRRKQRKKKPTRARSRAAQQQRAIPPAGPDPVPGEDVPIVEPEETDLDRAIMDEEIE